MICSAAFVLIIFPMQKLPLPSANLMAIVLLRTVELDTPSVTNTTPHMQIGTATRIQGSEITVSHRKNSLLVRPLFVQT